MPGKRKKNKKQKFSALESMVKAPRRIKPEGKPEEELIYANQEEIQMLKRAGGSGTPTQFGVSSFAKGRGPADKKSEDNIMRGIALRFGSDDVDVGDLGSAPAAAAARTHVADTAGASRAGPMKHDGSLP